MIASLPGYILLCRATPHFAALQPYTVPSPPHNKDPNPRQGKGFLQDSLKTSPKQSKDHSNTPHGTPDAFFWGRMYSPSVMPTPRVVQLKCVRVAACFRPPVAYSAFPRQEYAENNSAAAQNALPWCLPQGDGKRRNLSDVQKLAYSDRKGAICFLSKRGQYHSEPTGT